jgi:hypothetical protein
LAFRLGQFNPDQLVTLSLPLAIFYYVVESAAVCIRLKRSALLYLWNEGLNSGPGRFANIKAIKAEARRSLKDTQE